MKTENSKWKRRGLFLSILFAVCMIAAMMPLMAFADDDEDRASGNLYILGTNISGGGEAGWYGVDYTGFINYDPENKELTLRNVTLDMNNYKTEEGIESNYVAAISAWSDLTITLEGNNYIICDRQYYVGDKEYVFGLRNACGKTLITKSEYASDDNNSLTIEMYADFEKAYSGISCCRDLTVRSCDINVDMKEPVKCCGMDLGCGNFMIEDEAHVDIKAPGDESIGVNGSGIFDKSYVSNGSSLCMAGGSLQGTAFNCYYPSDALKDTPAFVSENYEGENAEEWDKTTDLFSYHYILFKAPEGSTPPRGSGSVYILGTKVKDGVVPDNQILHEGTIYYDAASNKLTLTNAKIDLFYFSREVDGNVVAGIYSTSDLEVELVGKNEITSTNDLYIGDREYVYGIWGCDKVNIVGKQSSTTDSLNITIAKNYQGGNEKIGFSAIESDGEITFDSVSANFDLGQYGRCDGIYSWGPLKVMNESNVVVNADGSNSNAVNGINAIGNSVIEEDSCLEMISEGTAFNCWTPSADLKATPVLVNEKPTAEGANPWTQSARLYTYKYVKFRGWNPPKVPLEDEKADNTLKVKGKTATVKYKTLKKKSQTLKVSKAVKFTKKGQGKLSYQYVSAKKDKKSFKKYFRINEKNGNVTVKKGLKKGTYKVKVKVRAAGNEKYPASSWKKVTFRIRVK